MTKATDDCPAGGAHTPTVLEEPGSGKTWWGCDECGATIDEEDMEDVEEGGLEYEGCEPPEFDG